MNTFDVAEDPDEWPESIRDANALWSEGHLAAAISAYELYIEEHGDDPDALFNLGMLYRETERLDESRKTYLRCLEIDDSPDVLRELGRVERADCNYDEAIEWLQKSLKIDPDSDIALNNIGLNYNSLGKYNKAIQFLERGLKLYPKDGYMHRNLGNSLVMLGRKKRALACYKLAVKYGPEVEKCIESIIELLQEASRWKSAKKWSAKLQALSEPPLKLE